MNAITKAIVPASLGCFLLIGSVGFAQDATEAPADGDEVRVRRFERVRRGPDRQERHEVEIRQGDGPPRGRRGGGARGRLSRDGDGPGRGGRGGRGLRGRRGPGGSMLHGLLAHAEELELTEDQQAQIKEIATESRKAMVQLRADSELAGMELQALIRSDDPDLEAIQQGLENVASAQVAERFAAIEATVSARSVLTDEQQAKVKEAVRGQRGPQRGNGPKRGDGPKRGGRPERSGR